MKTVYFVMGVTNVGKTYFIDKNVSHLNSVWPGSAGSVLVGKIMREKYPPSYFEGQGAPEKTEAEALQIYETELEKNNNCSYVFVDGQPRRVSQVLPVFQIAKRMGFHTRVFWLHRNVDVLRDRIATIQDEEKRALAEARLVNDHFTVYETLHHTLTAYPGVDVTPAMSGYLLFRNINT